MKGVRLIYISLSAITLLAAGLACNFPGSGSGVASTQTLEALGTIAAATIQAAEEVPTEQATAPPPTTIAEATESVIIHEMVPEDPVALTSDLTDLSSAAFAEEHRAIGDSFNINLLERPFTPNEMNYEAYLDIIYAELGVSQPWVYAVIYLQEAPPEGTAANYSIEIDLDLDGRGDWLITAALPPSSEWTTDGVLALRDSNDDVGGEKPVGIDDPNPERDGFDELVFNQGQGEDPDAAWVRRDPEYPERIQFAIKLTLIDSDEEFLWGAWADAGVNEPLWFDYHDHFPIEEAGDPSTSSDHYPIKALASVDNTCRWAFGFEPMGFEPGLCGGTASETQEPGGGVFVCSDDFPPVCSCQPTCPPGGQPCSPCSLP